MNFGSWIIRFFIVALSGLTISLISPPLSASRAAGQESVPDGNYIGYSVCNDDSDCPQYATCRDYLGFCTENLNHWFVGTCLFDENLACCYRGLTNHCVECSPTNKELVTTGTRLCFYETITCASDEDCVEPGLFCNDSHYCEEDAEEQKLCQNDADCRYGWECISFPEGLFDPACYGGNDNAIGGVDVISAGSDHGKCCWNPICNPRGNLKPIVACQGVDIADEGGGHSPTGSCAAAPVGSAGILSSVALLIVISHVLRRRLSLCLLITHPTRPKGGRTRCEDDQPAL